MATPNPSGSTDSSSPPPISTKTFPIAGILTTVYGLEEIPLSCDSVAVLWLLHPRQQTKEDMASVGSACIHAWNQRLRSGEPRSSTSTKGMIAVSFDQRNHGSREVNKLSNEAWRGGNSTHAQDMFSIYHGTAIDTSLLIDHLESYIFLKPNSPKVVQNFVLGISLGGHAAWQVIFHDPRVSAAVVIIGCPDYMRVMTDRARLSKLDTYLSSNGTKFLGSKDFPRALIQSIKQRDPRGLLFGTAEIQTQPSSQEQERIRKILDAQLRDKSILVCSGGVDKLVPYHCTKPFMDFLKNATKVHGWYSDGNVYVEDNVYEGIGHATSDEMLKDSARFFIDLMEEKDLSRQFQSPKM